MKNIHANKLFYILTFFLIELLFVCCSSQRELLQNKSLKNFFSEDSTIQFNLTSAFQVLNKNKNKISLFNYKNKISVEVSLLNTHGFDFIRKNEFKKFLKYYSNFEKQSLNITPFKKINKFSEGEYSEIDFKINKVFFKQILVLKQNKIFKVQIGLKSENKKIDSIKKLIINSLKFIRK